MRSPDDRPRLTPEPARRRWVLGGLAGGVVGRLAGGLPAQMGLATATLLGLGARAARAAGGAPALASPAARPGTVLQFPVDHGAHPEFRTEWWYATGALRTPADELLGFQITFFRSRVDALVPAHGTPVGRFAPRHLLFAHAALTDVAAQRQWHAQRLGRWNGDPAVRPDAAGLADTAIRLGGWSLVRTGGQTPGQSLYQAAMADADMGFELTLATTQPLLLQGQQGFSRKGPEPTQASHYYSQPQLAITGTVQRAGRRQPVKGTAWLDHEWSETLLPPDAVGWDWVGMNLDNGACLTAFQLRRADGSALWAGGSWRAGASAPVRSLSAHELTFTPGQRWFSPVSQGSYPLQWRLDTPVGRFEVRALAQAQELDSRQSTGTVYWEGLSELVDAQTGQRVGLGYLEMTGYAGKLRL